MNIETIKAQWALLASKKLLTSRFFIERAILIGMSAKNAKNVPVEDIITGILQKSFSRITNRNKLANGQVAYGQILQYTKMAQNTSFEYFKNHKILGLDQDQIFTNDDEKRIFWNYAKNLRVDKLGRQYVYYFTAQDGLTKEQQGVQSAHVMFVLGHTLHQNGINVDPNHTYFQWIGAKGEKELKDIRVKHQHPSVTFRESDLGNQLTGVAFYPILWNKREEFLGYELLTHDN